jgi:hypothetical protein
MRRALVGSVAAFALVGACGSSSPTPVPPIRTNPPGMPLCAATSGTPVAHVSIGPDASLEVLCSAQVQGPVASITNMGGGILTWSVTITGDSAFVVDAKVPKQICNDGLTRVVSVLLAPPATALPGDTFDAVVTISAANGEFPSGTVKVHGVVVTPRFVADPQLVDFGVVEYPSSMPRVKGVTLRNDSGVVLFTRPPPVDAAFLYAPAAGVLEIRPGTQLIETVTLTATFPGTYTAAPTWSAAGVSTFDVPAACLGQVTAQMRAIVVVASEDGGTD